MNLTWKNGLLLFLGVVIASAIGHFIATPFINKRSSQAPPSQLHAHAHEVLQRDLKLSAEQVQTLEEIEIRFLKRESKLKAANAAAVARLADALERDRAYSADVDATIAEIHETQGEIQKATIEHLLEMKSVLTTEQHDKLLSLVAKALRHRTED
tara:strand:- start:489 stop:953 length:465 start_codon:yes stop_codon:yes gene_type:complete